VNRSVASADRIDGFQQWIAESTNSMKFSRRCGQGMQYSHRLHWAN